MTERSGYDRRQFTRYSVDWVASIMQKTGSGSGEIFRDRIGNISLGGAGIYTNSDIYTEKSLVMLIETPLPNSYGKHGKIITGIQCNLCKPVFLESSQQFHTGVRFERFYGIDKHLLSEALFMQHKAIARRKQEADSRI